MNAFIPKDTNFNEFQMQQAAEGLLAPALQLKRILSQSEWSDGSYSPPRGESPNAQGYICHWHVVDKYTASMLLGIIPDYIRGASSEIQESMANTAGIRMESMNASGQSIFIAERYEGPYRVGSWELLTDEFGVVYAMGHYSRDRNNKPERSIHEIFDFRSQEHKVQITETLDGIRQELVDGKSELIFDMEPGLSQEFLHSLLNSLSPN